MIINIRGTHGSGKSTIVRKIRDSRTYEPITIDGRARPLGYQCSGKLFIPGSYENPCGGCDTIPRVELVYELVAGYAEKGWHVLFEGILAQHTATRVIALHRQFPLIAVVLTTPVSECIISTLARRTESGNEKPFNPANLEREAKGVLSAAKRLKSNGVNVKELSRQDAEALCAELLQ
jgi:hypothetical protein